jgi:hypothetical protein
MTGQEFKMIVEEVCAEKNIKKTVLSINLGISKVTLNKYEKNGVPPQKLPLIMHRLKTYRFDVLQPV